MHSNDFSNMLTLMRAQNTYISQAVKYIFSLYSDLNLAGNTSFQEFALHFHTFIINHASSEGFSKAIETQQVCNYVLLDKLLTTQVLTAAENLETAISHLELVGRLNNTRTNPKLLLLNHSISLLEETELKIIEILESILENSCKIQLQN
ncbi:MAG: hypothetical protein GX348_08355 [Veillonellaceae bacterium]|nr:hypothetical protein [Veillonellaceae bacterium]